MNRLRAYRALEGLNQEELAELLEVSPQLVSMIESGRRSATVDLTRLGYEDDRLDLPDMSAPMHRIRASTKVAAKKRACELLRLGGEVFADLRERTKRAPRIAFERLGPPQDMDDAEAFAAEVRFAIGQEEHGPIRDLTAAVERAGICLVPVGGLEGIDGLSSWVGDVPVIGISPTSPGDRFRHTLAHEIGHLMMHTRPHDHTESEANRFAGALLFPAEDFDSAMPTRPQLRDFVALKASWGASVASLVYRAHELDYIDDKRYRALQIQMSKWRKKEPGSFDPVPGKLLTRLVEVNGGTDAVARELGVNRSHLAELTNWRHLRRVA